MTYHTAQKQLLIDFLRDHADEAFTVEELAYRLAGEPAPGKSTLYRLLPLLAESGEVKRIVKDGTRKAMYQAVGCRQREAHLHLKCTDCGKLLHLDNDASTIVLRNVLRNSHFAVDEKQTVLFGKCGACRKGGAV